jgi:hypothetical protein
MLESIDEFEEPPEPSKIAGALSLMPILFVIGIAIGAAAVLVFHR